MGFNWREWAIKQFNENCYSDMSPEGAAMTDAELASALAEHMAELAINVRDPKWLSERLRLTGLSG